jgi:hypothetical protein
LTSTAAVNFSKLLLLSRARTLLKESRRGLFLFRKKKLRKREKKKKSAALVKYLEKKSGDSIFSVNDWLIESFFIFPV